MDVSNLEPLVSVVIPIYNVEKYLDRCVSSVVNQTYRNLEIILVDDGSMDHCPAMCDAWARRDGRIKVIHKKNAGLGMARNSGLEVANGKYVCFFDSDDYVDGTAVEKCVNSAEEHQADVVIFGICVVCDDEKMASKKVGGDRCVFRDGEVMEILLPGLFTYRYGVGVSSCGRMYRRSVLEENRLRFHSERELISEDAFFALEFYSKANTAIIVPENLYFYCYRPVSLSRQYREDRQTKNDSFFVQSIAYINQNDLPVVVATHLTVRYHILTIAALKQTMSTDMSADKKKKKVKEILQSPILSRSLKLSVLRMENWKMRMFFLALKIRAYWLCYLLLKYKIHHA